LQDDPPHAVSHVPQEQRGKGKIDHHLAVDHAVPGEVGRQGGEEGAQRHASHTAKGGNQVGGGFLEVIAGFLQIINQRVGNGI
jgi:hypothetical protein